MPSSIVHFKLSDGSVQRILADTLKAYPNTYLSTLVENDGTQFKSNKDEQGCFSVDEGPVIFSAILDFYRHGFFMLSDVLQPARKSIINKYLLPIDVVPSPQRAAELSDKKIYVHLHGIRANVLMLDNTTQNLTCTKSDPVWKDLEESINSGFGTTANNWIMKSPITVMNYLTSKDYELVEWDKNNERIFMQKTINTYHTQKGWFSSLLN